MENWLNGHHAALIAEIGFVWLAIQKFLTAIQDAVDAQPKDLKPPFGKIIYYMTSIGGYLFAGNRPQAITKVVMVFMLLGISMFLSSNSFAQNSATPPDIVTILDGVTMDVGTGYDLRNHNWVQTDTARFLEYNKTSNSGKFSFWLNGLGKIDPRVSLGYSTSNKGVVGGGFHLIAPSSLGITSPLLRAVSVDPFAQYEIFSIGNVPSETKKGWIFGVYIVKGSF